jgi:hypothetical protein
MNKWIEILTGLILLVVGIYSWGTNLWGFGDAALSLLKGGIIWLVLFAGFILIILGISDLKE